MVFLVASSLPHAEARFSLEGEFGAATDQQDVVFRLARFQPTGSGLNFRTWSYSGSGTGTNYAGDTIPAGGFDPTLELRNYFGEMVAFTDDGRHVVGNHDSELDYGSGDPPLPDRLDAGNYTVRLNVKDDDFAGRARHWAMDIAGPAEDMTLFLSDIDHVSGSSGISKVSVIGQESLATTSDSLVIGDLGSGALAVRAGGMVSTLGEFNDIGRGAGSTGLATVTGAGSQWNNTGDLRVGHEGTGTLVVDDGGVVSNESGFIGDLAGSMGQATVSGYRSRWNSTSLYIGHWGAGSLRVEDRGVAWSTFGNLGAEAGSTGLVTVTGAGSRWNDSGNLFIGERGGGTLKVESGGIVSVGGTTIIGPLGAIHLDGGTFSTSSTTNDGEFSSATANTIGGDFTNNSTVHGPTIEGEFLTFADDVIGSGNYTGNVEFLQTFAPGNGAAVQFAGDVRFTDSTTLGMELGGRIAGEEYDQLLIDGQFYADGILVVVLPRVTGNRSFNLSADDTFDLFDFTSVHGSFDEIILPALPEGLGWDTSSLLTTGELSITIPEPATLGLLVLAAVMVRRRERGVRIVSRNS